MKPFLKLVAEDIYNTYNGNFSDLELVFPSKRAVLYFKKYLKETIKENSEIPYIFPSFYAIENWVESYSEKVCPEQFELIIILFEAYLSTIKEASHDIESFFPFGEMLLKDFDETHRYLIDINKLFFNLKAIEKLKEQEILDLMYQYKSIEQFVHNLNTYTNLEIKEKFQLFWEKVGALHAVFLEMLQKQNVAFKGLLFRELSEKISNDTSFLRNNRVVFIGFNALTHSEFKIIDTLLKHNKSTIYWKHDELFFTNVKNDAGKFIREFLDKWKYNEHSKVIQTKNLNQTKHINLVECSLNISQSKYLSKHLKSITEEDEQSMVVVLCDEKLLTPVLSAIPKNITSVNITTGVPLSETILYSLVNYLVLLLKTNKKSFYVRNLTAVLNHPYVQILGAGQLNKFIHENIKPTTLFVDEVKLKILVESVPNLSFLSFIINGTSVCNFFENIEKSIEALKNSLFNLQIELDAQEKESFIKFNQIASRLQVLINKFESKVSLNTDMLEKLFKQTVFSTKITLEGEPLTGLQIMGALETRSLDFKNIVFLNFNEGIFPSSSFRSTLIPHSVRLAFEMPTYKTSELIYSNLFYNVIQQSKNVTFVYNSEAGFGSNGEVSRFAKQLQIDYGRTYKNLIFNKNIFAFDIQTESDVKRNQLEINEIHKTNEIIQLLISRYSTFEKGLSPSALINYINCSMKFYYSYVLGVKEEEETLEELGPMHIGNLIHMAMELIYKDVQVVTKDVVLQSFSRIDSVVEQAITVNNYNDLKGGYNEFVLLGVKSYIKTILHNDLNDVPFEVIGLEQEHHIQLTINENNIFLKGNIDHVRIKDGVIQIVDYKTGKMPDGLKFSLNKMISDLEKNIQKYKYIFQIMMYSFLYKSKNMSGKIQPRLLFLRDNTYVESEGFLQENDFTNFEDELKKLLNDLFNVKKTFKKTDDKEKCLNCGYKVICLR